MRIATYNVEWFNSLFDDDGTLLFDQGWSGRYNVTREQQLTALGVVFSRLDADAIMIIEVPDHSRARRTHTALENFANHFGLRANTVLIGFSNDTQQEIAFLYDANVIKAQHRPIASVEAPRFDEHFEIDLDVDARLDTVTFSKPPLELSLQLKDGRCISAIGVHLKSKAPHGARTPTDAMRLSIANRRKQLAQSIWLRRRITQLLEDRQSVMVLGDFNDGPGLDEYENLFGRSSIEIVMGQDLVPALGLFDPHAAELLGTGQDCKTFSAQFYDHKTQTSLKALLDYIFVSKNLGLAPEDWKIWNPVDPHGAEFDKELRQALLLGSDHFPVVLDIS